MIIITGASRGVGKYLFDRFIMEGQEVYGTYNNTPIQSNIDKGTYYQVNIVDALSVERWIQLIHHNLNNIVLINCAGVSYNSFAHKADVEKWSEV